MRTHGTGRALGVVVVSRRKHDTTVGNSQNLQRDRGAVGVDVAKKANLTKVRDAKPRVLVSSATLNAAKDPKTAGLPPEPT